MWLVRPGVVRTRLVRRNLPGRRRRRLARGLIHLGRDRSWTGGAGLLRVRLARPWLIRGCLPRVRGCRLRLRDVRLFRPGLACRGLRYFRMGRLRGTCLGTIGPRLVRSRLPLPPLVRRRLLYLRITALGLAFPGLRWAFPRLTRSPPVRPRLPRAGQGRVGLCGLTRLRLALPRLGRTRLSFGWPRTLSRRLFDVCGRLRLLGLCLLGGRDIGFRASRLRALGGGLVRFGRRLFVLRLFVLLRRWWPRKQRRRRRGLPSPRRHGSGPLGRLLPRRRRGLRGRLSGRLCGGLFRRGPLRLVRFALWCRRGVRPLGPPWLLGLALVLFSRGGLLLGHRRLLEIRFRVAPILSRRDRLDRVVRRRGCCRPFGLIGRLLRVDAVFPVDDRFLVGRFLRLRHLRFGRLGFLAGRGVGRVRLVGWRPRRGRALDAHGPLASALRLHASLFRLRGFLGATSVLAIGVGGTAVLGAGLRLSVVTAVSVVTTVSAVTVAGAGLARLLVGGALILFGSARLVRLLRRGMGVRAGPCRLARVLARVAAGVLRGVPGYVRRGVRPVPVATLRRGALAGRRALGWGILLARVIRSGQHGPPQTVGLLAVSA
ncbi:hypothetical protein [Longimycelium tulufanense]|uniref:hypothetical protein n=1 Tax=Longimycelium tulufanense TaxID=907463 RepID=UPI00166B9B8E|nr:hypothetical protein [Longimycelium tulufanense]